MTPDGGMTDIHDIRPPVMVGMDPAVVKLCVYIGVGVLAVALIVFVIRRVLKRQKQGPARPGIPMLSAYDTAIAALDRLGQASMVDSVQGAKQFYFELGHIIKQYLGATRGFNCLEMTTQELGKQLKAVNDLPGSLKSDVVQFQDICDPFRYAPDLAPEKNRMDRDLSTGRALIKAMDAARTEAQNKTADGVAHSHESSSDTVKGR